MLLVVFVLLWGYKPVQQRLSALDPDVRVAGAPQHHSANAAGGLQALRLRRRLHVQLAFRFRNSVSLRGHARRRGSRPESAASSPRCWDTPPRQLALAELTLAAVLALAFLMNYSGATATLGLAFAATGVMFPFFSALLGWLGVFLTGSDTSANALFGTLASGDRRTSWE